jgi:CRP-like cAMP-binding protein
MDPAELADRFREVLRSLDTDLAAPLRLLTFQDLPDGVPLPNLDTDQGQAALYREIEAMDRCDVVVLDNRTTLFRSDRDTNTPESWQRGQLFLQELTRRYGVATVLAHHDGKNRQQRGTSEIETVMAQCVHLTELRDGPDAGARFKVTLTKNRAGIRGDAASPFTAHLIRDEKGRLAWSLGRGAPSDEEIVELVATGMSKAAVAAELGINRATVYRALERQRRGGG